VNEAIERWREERGRSGRASAGWADTLAAASDGRVEVLLLGDGARQKAYRCPQCGRAEASAGTCPLDGTELEPGAGADLAVERTLEQGGAIVTVLGGELDDAEGVGALLRF
jgi:peptide subunit release factor 1 (eRF1)